MAGLDQFDKECLKNDFKSLLASIGSYARFIKLLRSSGRYNENDDSIYIYHYFTNECQPSGWVNLAGDWYDSPEGVDFWEDVDHKLSVLISMRLNRLSSCNSIW